VKNGVESSRSAEASATPIPPPVLPPSAPTSVTATAGHTQIGLSWTAPAGAVSYKVYRGTTPGGEGATPIATGITGTSYIDAGLTDGVTYYYRVSALNAGGEGSPSLEVSATSKFLVLAIDAGGAGAGAYGADTDVVGTPPVFVTGAAIDTSGVFQ